MHAQEVAQEVLAPQEHASGQKKLNCGLSARSSKRKNFKILSARSHGSNRKPQIAARSYSSTLARMPARVELPDSLLYVYATS